MKNLLGICLLSVIVVSVARGKKTSSTGMPVQSASTETRLRPLDYEAVQQAVELWTPTTHGDSSYVCQMTLFPLAQRPVTTIVQLRKAVILVSPPGSPMSEADKLNGLEWEGTVALSAGAARSYHDYAMAPFFSANSWCAWESGQSEIRPIYCEKRNGKWDIRQTDTYKVTFKKVEQSDIPDSGAPVSQGVRILPKPMPQ